MGDSDASTLDSSVAVALTGKIMVISIIVLFIVVVFVVLLHVYARWFWWRIEEEEDDNSTRPQQRRRRERRFVFTPAGQQLTVAAAAAARRGLDPTVLKSLPVRVFQAKDFKEGLECAVCLCELEEGEKARLLPKCNHGFHLECINMWFQSHTTCPICRNSVASDSSSGVDSDATFRSVEENFDGVREIELTESPNLPTNVLFWGDENEVNSRNAAASMEEGAASSSSLLVIDIPRQVMEELHCSLPSELQLPISKRLRSLRRLLSMADRKASPGSQSSNCADVDAMA